jgi:hypothetical protein
VKKLYIKKIAPTLWACAFLGVTAITSAYADDRGEPSDEVNKKTVREGVELCKKSACWDCGRFRYSHDTHVEYSASSCELEFKFSEELKEEKRVDSEIRHKYLADGGKP